MSISRGRNRCSNSCWIDGSKWWPDCYNPKLSVHNLRMKRSYSWMAVATLAAISGGCAANPGVSKKQNIPVQARPVARVATREELLGKYNSFASSLKTLNATVELKTTAGSQYSGL